MCTTCGCSVGQARVNGKSIAAHLTTGQSLKYRPLEQAHSHAFSFNPCQP
ncbi:MAG: hypothetical protein V9G16_12500 [Nitrosomonas sp.]